MLTRSGRSARFTRFAKKTARSHLPSYSAIFPTSPANSSFGSGSGIAGIPSGVRARSGTRASGIPTLMWRHTLKGGVDKKSRFADHEKRSLFETSRHTTFHQG